MSENYFQVMRRVSEFKRGFGITVKFGAIWLQPSFKCAISPKVQNVELISYTDSKCSCKARVNSYYIY